MISIPSYDLSARNTFRMKVSCALYIEIEAEKELLTLDWNALPQPILVLGGGSNLLFTADFPGTVLHIALCHSERSEESVTLGAGVIFDEFCTWAAAEGLWGPENLSLIPGEVGASAVQNIGAYGVEAKDIIADIRAYDRVEGRFVHIDPATCGYGYRTSKFKTEWQGRYIITAVTYRLSKEPKPILDYGGVRKAYATVTVPGVKETSNAYLTTHLYDMWSNADEMESYVSNMKGFRNAHYLTMLPAADVNSVKQIMADDNKNGSKVHVEHADGGVRVSGLETGTLRIFSAGGYLVYKRDITNEQEVFVPLKDHDVYLLSSGKEIHKFSY